MPDRRALSVRLALDPTTVDNGSVWYVPGSQREPTRPHRWAGPRSDTLVADVGPDEGASVPLALGDCIFHYGNILHFTKGNTTDWRRRALIVNYRPTAMIAWERERGFEHRTENDRDAEVARQPTA